MKTIVDKKNFKYWQAFIIYLNLFEIKWIQMDTAWKLNNSSSYKIILYLQNILNGIFEQWKRQKSRKWSDSLRSSFQSVSFNEVKESLLHFLCLALLRTHHLFLRRARRFLR